MSQNTTWSGATIYQKRSYDSEISNETHLLHASKKSQKINFYLNEFTGYNDIKPLTPHNSHSIYYTIYLLYFRWATTGFIHSWRDKLNDHRECFAASFFWVCLRAVVADFFLAFFSFSFGCFDQLTKWKICFAVFYNSQTLFDF